MLAWLSNNMVTIIVLAVLLLVLGLAVYTIVKDRKHHSGGCTGNCAACKMGCCGKNK